MRIHANILIQRPILTVFSYLSTPASLPCWIAGVVAADGPAPDQQEVGALLIVERTAQAGRARSTWEVISYEPPRTLALRSLDGVGAEVRWILEAAPPWATRVWVEADVQAVCFFELEPRHLDNFGTRQLQDNLEVLRSRLEADARDAPDTTPVSHRVEPTAFSPLEER
jgi:uncharacterized protein YndB with AHSA1/START domain